ncbi:MAG: glycogen synthase [Acidimicrobiaceae bacterium]
MTRVLAVTNWYPPHHFGGYELSCFDVMKRLVARGHDVAVLTSDEVVPGASSPDADHERLVSRTLRLYHRHDEIYRPGVGERLAIERHNQAALKDVLERHQPDVASVWHMGALSLGLLSTLMERDVPQVFSVCDDWLLYGEKLDAWTDLFRHGVPKQLAGTVVSRVTGVPSRVGDLGAAGAFLFVSEFIRSRAERMSRWTFPCSTVVYSGIERAIFDAQPRPGTWSDRLLFVGRWDPRKGAHTAIRALEHLPGATLQCFGRGSETERAALVALAERLGLADRVDFAQVDRHELPPIYAAADAFVFPSEWDEPFGLVPVEAMACGTPVVATIRGGSAEFLVDGANCVQFEAGAADDLARAVRRVRDDAALRDRIVAGGLALAAELDVERLADTFEQWHTYAASGFQVERPADRVLP